MSDTLNFGIIGCGGMTGAHLDGMKRLYEAGLRDFRVGACCDLVEGAAQGFAAKCEEALGHRPAVYTDFEKMLEAESGLDAVDVSVVHREHHRIGTAVLEAGKHLFLEKPLALTMRSGKLLMEAAEKAGKVLYVAENYRRDPSQRAMAWAVKSGRIGPLRMVFRVDLFERLWHWGWRESKLDAGGGWMLDGGVHTADLLLFLAGRVESVYGQVRAYYPFRHGTGGKADLTLPAVAVDTEDTTLALLEFASGATGSWLLSSVAPGKRLSVNTLYGSQGALDAGEGIVPRDGAATSMEALIGEYRASLSEAESERWFPHGVTHSVATEIAEFVRAVREGGPVETGGREGYEALAVCFAIYESQATGQPVKVSDVEDLKVEEYQAPLNESLGL